jgi:hypothetical protein
MHDSLGCRPKERWREAGAAALLSRCMMACHSLTSRWLAVKMKRPLAAPSE